MTTDRIRRLIVDNFEIPPDFGELPDDLPFVESHLLDSLDMLSLVGLVEAEFDLPVRDEDVVLENFGSIERIAAYVDRSNAAA
jgi:acyl carrier protein